MKICLPVISLYLIFWPLMNCLLQAPYCWLFQFLLFYDLSHLMTKPTKWHVRPAKTRISLSLRQVWSASSLSAWRKLGSLATHWVHNEESDQTGWMAAQADPSLRWAHSQFVGFCHEAAHRMKLKLMSIISYFDSWLGAWAHIPHLQVF